MFEETYTSGEQILKVETRRLHGVRTCQRPLCASRASAHKRERGGSWAGLWICCVPASDKVHPSGLSFSYVQNADIITHLPELICSRRWASTQPQLVISIVVTAYL